MSCEDNEVDYSTQVVPIVGSMSDLIGVNTMSRPRYQNGGASFMAQNYRSNFDPSLKHFVAIVYRTLSAAETASR
jgi:hypothetical protein